VPTAQLPEPLRVSNDASQDYAVDSSRIRDELGYAEPVPQEEALRRTIEWERANPPDHIDPAEFEYDSEDRALAALARPA
jgi:dTDP-D-glucose 4,6-dehydratase